MAGVLTKSGISVMPECGLGEEGRPAGRLTLAIQLTGAEGGDGWKKQNHLQIGQF